MFSKEKSGENRRAAIANGDKTYISITPCRKCGGFIRYVSSYGCQPCGAAEGLKKLKDDKLMAPYRTKEKANVWKKANPEKVKKTKKRYKDANKEKIKVSSSIYYPRQRAAYLERHYGVTIEQYDVMLKEQDNRCAICGTAECSSGRNFAVDHDHETGRVRGLLCGNCNVGIGNLRDDINIMKRAIAYLEKN